MNLKLRLNLIITALLFVVMLIGAWVMLKSARDDVRAEVKSTASLALHLIDAEILYYTSDFSWINFNKDQSDSIFRLKSLENIRHLKIEFYDLRGRLRDSNKPSSEERLLDTPPDWFVKAMDIASGDKQKITRQVYVSGRLVGELIVTPDPLYEISEVWNDTLGTLMMVGIFFVFVNLIVYGAVARALNPISKILNALTAVEAGKLDVRLPAFDLPELSSIAGKFNSMVDTLQKTIQNNHQLTQQMIQVQEVERKSLARDIHDEIGQYLTAIDVDATVILGAKSFDIVSESARAIRSVTKNLMDIVHDISQRLRPGVLDELGLAAALLELVDGWKQRNKEFTTTIDISYQLDDVDETTAITVYRIVQESFTNIARHSDARRVSLKINRQSDFISIFIQDDGKGYLMDAKPAGFGLAGMRERVYGLGGKIEMSSALNVGTTILVILPVKRKIGG